MKPAIRRGVYHTLLRSGSIAFQRQRRIRKEGGWATILVFHTLSDTYPHDGITMSPALFRQIVMMLRAKYTVLSLTDLYLRVCQRLPFTGREVVITFDDGYLDNYEYAAPILKECGLPACFYLTAGYIGTRRQFDWDVAKGRRTVMMDWSQAREMVGMGFEIGCHTWSHPDLGVEPIQSATRELHDARSRLEQELGSEVVHFAYPFGGSQNIRAEWIDAIRRMGFLTNVSCHGGHVLPTTDLHLIPRVGCHQRTITDVRIEVDRPW